MPPHDPAHVDGRPAIGHRTMGRHVTNEASAEARRDDGDTATTRVTIGPGFGCEALEQRVIRFSPGRSRPRTGGAREELLFAVSGSATLHLGGSEHALEPETGVVVPPGERYEVENEGPDDLVVVSVLALEPKGDTQRMDAVAVRLAEQPPHPAGKDREFRYVANEEVGCRTVTQFVGSIPPGRAKPHYHTYEEVAYILEGEGVLHMGGESSTVRGGLLHSLSTAGAAHSRERRLEDAQGPRRLPSGRRPLDGVQRP
jgi:mannose-6-phosphate isomerase-like protein (cupin superfamily)